MAETQAARQMSDREVDWAIWEKVFGHVVICKPEIEEQAFAVLEESLPHYSTDIAAAMEVVKAITKNYPFMLLEDRYGGTYSGGNWIAYFGVGPEAIARGAWGSDGEAAAFWGPFVDYPNAATFCIGTANTPARAICKAALKSKEMKHPI